MVGAVGGIQSHGIDVHPFIAAGRMGGGAVVADHPQHVVGVAGIAVVGAEDAGELSGDSHFWDVWHSRKPIKSYELWKFRFVSEFGMQSYSSAATNARAKICDFGKT